MVNFSELAIPFVIFLIAINAMFMAMSTLPGGQFAGDPKLFSGITDNNSFKDSMTSYITDANGKIILMHGTGTLDNNAIVTTQNLDITSIIFNIVNGATFGGLGYVTTYTGWMTQMAFGYTIWIDYFLNPNWHPWFFYIGFILKSILLVFQIYAILAIFTSLVGRRI